MSYDDQRRCSCGDWLDPLQLCDCPSAMAKWVEERTNLTHVARSLRKAAEKQKQTQQQLAAANERAERAEAKLANPSVTENQWKALAEANATLARIVSERAGKLQDRIDESQKQQPVFYTSGMGTISSTQSKEFPHPVYMKPIIPPDVEELQRELDERAKLLLEAVNDGCRLTTENAELERKLAEQQVRIQQLYQALENEVNCVATNASQHALDVDDSEEELTKLIAQAEAKQREEDAKICEMFYRDDGTAQQCAEAIRKGG